MRLIGDGVVDSILRGDNIGITPRRRTCTVQHQHLGHYTRTRSQTPSHVACSRVLPTGNASRKPRIRNNAEAGGAGKLSPTTDSDKEKDKPCHHHLRRDKRARLYNTDRDSASPSSLSDEVVKRQRPSKPKTNKGHKPERHLSDPDSENEVSRPSPGNQCKPPRLRAGRHRKLQGVLLELEKGPRGNQEEEEEEEQEEEESIRRDKSPRPLKSRPERTRSSCPKRTREKTKGGTSPSSSSASPPSGGEPDPLATPRSCPPTPPTCVRRCSVVLDAVEHHLSLSRGQKTSPLKSQSCPEAELSNCSLPEAELSHSPLPETESSASTLPHEAEPSGSPRPEVQPSDAPSPEAEVSGPPHLEPALAPFLDPTPTTAQPNPASESTTPPPQLHGAPKSPSSGAALPCLPPEQRAEPTAELSQSGNSSPCAKRLEADVPEEGGDSARSLNDAPTPKDESAPAKKAPPSVKREAHDHSAKKEDRVAPPVAPIPEIKREASSAEEPCSSTPGPPPVAKSPLVLDKNEPVRIWRDPKLVCATNSVWHISSVQHSTMAHPSGAAHAPYPGPGGGAAPPHPQQHGRGASAPTMNLAAHYGQHAPSAVAVTEAYLEQQAALRHATNPAPPPQASGAGQQQAYAPHYSVLPPHPHPHLLQQYQPMPNIDLMWQQKYQLNQPASTFEILQSQYHADSERVRRSQERQMRAGMERLQMERAAKRGQQEREKQDKLEKEKMEQLAQKERMERDRQEQKERVEKERLEHERVHRDVHQHFEESLRLASHKMAVGSPWPMQQQQQVSQKSMPSGGSDGKTTSSHTNEIGHVPVRVTSSQGGPEIVHLQQHPHHVAAMHHISSVHIKKEHDIKDNRFLVSSSDARYLNSLNEEHRRVREEEHRRSREEEHRRSREEEHRRSREEDHRRSREEDHRRSLEEEHRRREDEHRRSREEDHRRREEEHRRSREEEKWQAQLRHQEAAVTLASVIASGGGRHAEMQHRSAAAVAAHNYNSAEASRMQSASRHKVEYSMNPGYRPPKASPAPPSNSIATEPSPSLCIYGYQPFQHSYIMQDRGPTEPPKGHDQGKVLVTGSVTQTVAPSHQGRPGVPQQAYAEHERRLHPNHSSVIVSSESLRHEAVKGCTSSPKQQQQHTKVIQHHLAERTSPGYPGSTTAFRPYEYGSDGQLPRGHQQLLEPQNMHKSSTQHDPYACRPAPRSSPSTTIVSTASNYGGHGIATSASMSALPVMSTSSHPHAGPKAVPATFSTNLIQQGLVPNPIYNHVSPSGGGRGLAHAAPSHSPSASSTSSTSSHRSAGGKTATPPCCPLPLPARSSPVQPYGKASIVAGTPLCRPGQPYAQQTPPPAHRGSDLSRPPSAHSRPSSGPTPPSRTVTPSQTSHSPMERGGPPIAQAASPHLPVNHAGYSSPLPLIGSPHVPSPGGFSLPPRTASASSSEALRPLVASPPQTQPLDLQAPERQHRESESPGKRKAGKESPGPRKRPKAMGLGVANEGLAAAVASAHQIMSAAPSRVCAPAPLVSGATAAITTVVNSAALNTLAHTAAQLAPAQTVVEPHVAAAPHPIATNSNRGSGFLDSFRSFVNSTQNQQQAPPAPQSCQDYQAYQYGKHKGKHKAIKTEPTKAVFSANNFSSCSSNAGSASNTTSSVIAPAAATAPPSRQAAASPAQPSGGPSEPEKAVSPALSTSSASASSAPIPKLKKEWLIRHSNEDGKSVAARSESADSASLSSTVSSTVPIGAVPVKIEPEPVKTEPEPVKPAPVICAPPPSPSAIPSVNGHTPVKREPVESESSIEDSESDSVSSTRPSTKRKTRANKKKTTPIKDNKRHKGGHDTRAEKQAQLQEEEADDEEMEATPTKSQEPPRKRGRKPKSAKSARAEAVRKPKSSKLSSLKSGRLSLARLKRTGESFLQKGPCCEVAPKLSKCRECRMTQHQRSKKMPNIFCRFYEFRRLKYSKNGFLNIAGFSEPQDANADDLRLWLPPTEDPPADLEVDVSEFIVTHVGDQFCDLVEQEREAQAMHLSDDKTVAWKRVVQGVREMCDVCETTLFNIHWACSKCGFVVCIDCYKARMNGTVKEEDNPGKDRDEYSWLMCNNKQFHEQEKLMLTQIIAGNALWDMGKCVHEIRRKWGIASYCSCTRTQGSAEGKATNVNGICKQLMSAVSKPSNGSSDSIKGGKKQAKASNAVNGTLDYIKQDGGAGYNPDGASPLSWLADVALNSSAKEKDKAAEAGRSESSEEDGKGSESYSTLRELLIRPTSKNGSGTAKNNGTATGGHRKKSRLDEVINHVIEQSANHTDKTERLTKGEIKLMHYMKRYPQPKNGREPLPVRIFTHEESKLLFPGVPHCWLCSGRLLRLLDPYHKENLKLFQEMWKRGQPVLVSEVNKSLDMDLWHPTAFARDFGDIKNDLVNCSSSTIVPNQPMRKFWEGFESFAKRMKDDSGEYMLLKLKDWPPGDDFSELLPSRFDDLMKALPLPEYTHRNGLLNMAGRLPECFVRPDLGPKMYNAYGSAMHPDKGTTNLHLDISDAVNVMVYVGIPKDGDDEQHIKEALRAIEEGGCDTLSQRRVREKGQRPGALWHIYNARDADKIRDLLNKVAVERGEKLEAHHDPIHDQSWYLDGILRERLYKEYGVEGYAIAQCLGDAVFIPAGAPHQVRNLHSCIKVAEDFVSPENISHCFTLTQEFRDLSDTHTNHEDKLQVKNIIYHAVRDALALLMPNDPASCGKGRPSRASGESKHANS